MSDAILSSQFIYESAPFPSCHASTIVQTPGGILAAWFGGTHERNPDVCIYTSHLVDGKWSPPQEVADGIQSDGSRQPCWNPVLFQPRSGPLILFYKVGPNPRDWWGMYKTSPDHGHTWSDPTRLASNLLGPIKNKPVQLAGGSILSPSSIETVEPRWAIYFERSSDNGKSWTAGPLVEANDGVRAIQPSILIHPGATLQAIGRTRSGRLFETWSHDLGVNWSKLSLTDLPNCNSGTDAVTLADGRHLLIYNHSSTEKVRVPLNLAISHDGKAWLAGAVLEHEPPGQYSYPAIIQSSDGLVHVTYTWKRLKIKHMVIDPQRLGDKPIIEGQWPNA